MAIYGAPLELHLHCHPQHPPPLYNFYDCSTWRERPSLFFYGDLKYISIAFAFTCSRRIVRTYYLKCASRFCSDNIYWTKSQPLERAPFLTQVTYENLFSVSHYRSFFLRPKITQFSSKISLFPLPPKGSTCHCRIFPFVSQDPASCVADVRRVQIDVGNIPVGALFPMVSSGSLPKRALKTSS
jgi:hypothetical protein